MQENPYHTFVAYRDNNAWTSERGASKFLDAFIKSGVHSGKGDKGCVLSGMKVVQNPEGADFSVTIKANDGTSESQEGHCIIKYDDYAYLCWQDADYNLAIDGASQSMSRISYIVAYVDREITYVESDKIVESPSVMKFVEVKGSEASSPSTPTLQQIQAVVGINNPYVILAEVKVSPSASSIKQADITDRRIRASISGDFSLDPDNSWTTGFYQPAPNAGTKTRIVVTGPNAPTPAAIPGVELIWIRRKS